MSIGAVLGALCVVVALAAAIFDVRVLTFRSGSMSPTIGTGALALARHVPAADLHVGDIVSVRDSKGSRVTHRVVTIDRQGSSASLRLRGDANTVADAERYVVPAADRVFFSVPYLGYVAAILASPVGLVLLGVYVAALLRVIFRRHGAARHRGRTPVGLLAALAIVATAASLVVHGSATQAFWTDSVGTTGSTFSTFTVPAPTNFTCTPNLTSVTFNWTAVPGATSYYLHYGLNGATVSTPITGTSRNVSTPVVAGEAWVTTNINYGSVVWSSDPSASRGYTVFGIGLC